MLKNVTACSADHIELLQDLTHGHILVSLDKHSSLDTMRFYEPKCRVKPPSYFINCPFPQDIHRHEHRIADSYATKPGYRHDITLDFEKKKRIVSSNGKEHFIKDEDISITEKEDLIVHLQRLDYVGWAGPTPHGVHAGIYFPDWVAKSQSEQVLTRVMEDLGLAGYRGPVELDWGASINYNRPSRFIRAFAFWRPQARLVLSDLKPIPTTTGGHPMQATKGKPKVNKASTSPGLAVDPAIELALRARTEYKTAEETASEIGKSVAWVNELWAKNPQTTFNPWNRKIGLLDETGTKWRPIGPRTKRGRLFQRSPKLHDHAAWFWEWCRDQGMTLLQAVEHVGKAPEFAELLGEIQRAWEEDKRTNTIDPPKTKTWQEWLKLDIQHCYEKYAGWVSDKTLKLVRMAILILQKPRITVADIVNERAAINDKISPATVRSAFKKLGLQKYGAGKNSRYKVPLELISPTSQLSFSTQPLCTMKPVTPTGADVNKGTTSSSPAPPSQFPCVVRMSQNDTYQQADETKKRSPKHQPSSSILQGNAEAIRSNDPAHRRDRQTFRLDFAEYEYPVQTFVHMELLGVIETPENLCRKRKKHSPIVIFPEELPIYLIRIGECYGGTRQIRGLVEVYSGKLSFGLFAENDVLKTSSGRAFIEVLFSCDWPNANLAPSFSRGQPLRLALEQRSRAWITTRKASLMRNIADLPAFVQRMKWPPDPASSYFNKKLSKSTWNSLETYNLQNPDDSVLKSVLKDLRRIVKGPSMLHDSELSKLLTPKLKEVLAKTPPGKALIRAHWWTLTCVFPELAERPKSPRFHVQDWAICVNQAGPVDAEVRQLISDAQWDSRDLR